jgi:hypothetical protein
MIAMLRTTLGLVLSTLLLAGHPPGMPALEYVESSVGLTPPSLDGGPTEVEMVDVDGDGHVDLVSVGDHGNPFINTDQHGIILWRGDGKGGWSVSQVGEFGYGGIAAGDMNGDGLVDVAYGIHHDYAAGDLGDQILEVALGDGTGLAWTAWDDGLATNGETYGMSGTDVADVDGDGDLDVGSNSFGCCAGLHVYLNEGDGTWTQSFGLLGGNSDSELTFGDVNGDGWPDLAASHDSATVWIGDGQGDFRDADGNLPNPGAFNRAGVSLGDVDGDGRDELAWASSAGALNVWSWGFGDVWTDRSGSLPDSGPWDATQLWDMNGDGLTDLAAFGDGQFALWTGNGQGGWTAAGGHTTPSPGTYQAFRVGGDIDHNGLPDVVQVADEGGGFNTSNVLRAFREASGPTAPSARLVAPTAGATLRGGSVRFIHWAAGVPPGAKSIVRLGYSLNGPQGPWTSIAENVPNNGRFQWTAPSVSAPTSLTLGVILRTPHSKTLAVGPTLLLLPGH